MSSPDPAHELRRIVDAVKPLTMVSEAGVAFTVKSVRDVLHRQVPGDFVECGVWKGGCSIAMALTQQAVMVKPDRVVHLFDSFEGLPPCDPDVDGAKAAAWQADKEGATYFKNCSAKEQDVRRNVHRYGVGKDCVFWPGWFDRTLSLFDKPIAVLRLDCDWYSSVTDCLAVLMPKVSAGGVVIVDDYYAWDGCAKAVHDWLSRNDKPYRLQTIVGNAGAWFVKQ